MIPKDEREKIARGEPYYDNDNYPVNIPERASLRERLESSVWTYRAMAAITIFILWMIAHFLLGY